MNNNEKFIKTVKNILITTFLTLLVSCGANNNISNESQIERKISNEEMDYNEVIINNLGNTLKFIEKPQRVVTMNQHVTEVMLALGLEELVVGTAYLDDEILPEFQEAYNSIPVLANQYPSKETFLEQSPDFVYGGWSSAFQDESIGTVEDLHKLGINAYLQESSNIVGPKKEDVFADIRNIAKIFNVEDRANDLINSINDEIDNLQNTLGDIEDPLKVFVYDSGEDSPLTATQNFMTELISLAGGENIFSDIKKNWATVSWEEVVKRDPDVIVIIDYGEISVEDKQNYLLNNDSLSDITAIKNQNFTVLPLSAASEGIRIPIAVRTLAESFYPEKF